MIKYETNIRIDQDVDNLLTDNPVFDPSGAMLSKTKTAKYYIIQGVQACKKESSVNAAGAGTPAGA